MGMEWGGWCLVWRTLPHGWKEKAEEKTGTKKEANVEVRKH